MLMYAVLMLIVVMISSMSVLFEHSCVTVLCVNNADTACHRSGYYLQSYLDSYNSYADLTTLVYIYTTMLYGESMAVTQHHNDQHVWATCSVYHSRLAPSE